MYSISVCIPTYKRPKLLKKLIASISQCNTNKSLIKNVNIIIVDNDIDRTAEQTVSEIKKRIPRPYKIAYHNFPVRGLSNVRNELLKNAFLLNPDFLVFVDDDEYVTLEWLNELVKTIIANNGDLTLGPVISLMGNNVSRYISCWFERPNYKNNTIVNSIATNNLIIKTDSLLKYKIWFDHRFNKTGAEDSYFGQQMLKQGAMAYWAAKAIVYETVPGRRANIRWLIKRFYNGANTYTYILKIEKEYLKLVKKILTSLVYIIAGICTLVIILIPVRRKFWGLLKLSEGVGGIAGSFSLKYYEYK